MTVVVDASVVVAALVDSSENGSWAEAVIAEHELLAPHLLVTETLSVLRRLERAGDIESAAASQSVNDLERLPIQYVNETALTDQIWSLRHNTTSYDACYVILARSLALPLATLDLRLASQDSGVDYLTP